MAEHGPPMVIDVHTPVSSFAIIYSDAEDSLQTIFTKLTQKAFTELHGKPVRAGYVKYEWNNSFYNLDDDTDFSVFAWRLKSSSLGHDSSLVMFLRDPEAPLPPSTEYRNASFYMFRPRPISSPPLGHDGVSVRSGKSRRSGTKEHKPEDDGVPNFKKEFEQFHSENGVRTIVGSIGPVNNVRMLLKSGYRYVYISRKFAIKHEFIPRDAAPGHYGYSGLVNLGKWPITVGRTRSTHSVYLSEETHFDVILGRSFVEHRQIKFDPVDPTDVVCQDTGEKIDCEIVILRDGRGQIVLVS
ncbi:hypothetical protein BD309DRAFT_910616 [Dichomitus squalens]|uniref:uncharacterized protein n=1 Tax=Dichomitus squalens (strain LYAD-421) TaxID=732165 RepID=UPI000441456F|nr:uncharacterized protein DICSQDRAFT_152107 [Dichomitus squalens LYAD-421 SS1]EJF66107.1 hypothetical protein DICSQDRAFT_152107 [Dichomitus squalens LYAD-421 SS1]TBU49153.1 hypothetical protein BD309DRAFT_910616 [Dichomitus squalens]